jgi:hypothetical protein
MLLALMETCKDYVRERCHAPGRQQDGTTDGVTEACAPKNNLYVHQDKMLLLLLPALWHQ